MTQLGTLELLKDTGALLDWVYISPAPFVAPGERRGTYRRGVDMVIGDQISAEDFAVAVLDEVEHPLHHRSRFTVAWVTPGHFERRPRTAEAARAWTSSPWATAPTWPCSRSAGRSSTTVVTT